MFVETFTCKAVKENIVIQKFEQAYIAGIKSEGVQAITPAIQEK